LGDSGESVDIAAGQCLARSADFVRAPLAVWGSLTDFSRTWVSDK